MEDEVILKDRFHIPGRGYFSFFGVLDGHGGRSAAIYARDHLFNHLHAALTAGKSTEEALTQAYLNTDSNFIAQVRGDDSEDGVPAPAPVPILTLPSSENRRQMSASLAVRIPAASLPPVTTSVASARSSSAFVPGTAAPAPAAEKDTSGTTAVCVLIDHTNFTLTAANCGDSRAVLSTHSGAIIPLSNDHKADRADEVERIRRAGGFVVHKRVMGELAISRAIGDLDFKEPGFRFVLAHPELAVQQLSQHDDLVLLACDGIFDVLSNEQACAFARERISKGESLDDVALALVKHAIENLNTRDNVTVVLVKLPPTDELQRAGVARPDAPQLPAGTSGQAHLHDSHVQTPLPPTVASPAPQSIRSPFTPAAAVASASPAANTPRSTASSATAASPAHSHAPLPPQSPAPLRAPPVSPAPSPAAAPVKSSVLSAPVPTSVSSLLLPVPTAAATRPSLSPHSSASGEESGSEIAFHDDMEEDSEAEGKEPREHGDTEEPVVAADGAGLLPTPEPLLAERPSEDLLSQAADMQ